MDECRSKVILKACHACILATEFSGGEKIFLKDLPARQIIPDDGQSNLKTTNPETKGGVDFGKEAKGREIHFTCPLDCCPVGETVKLDLAYSHLFQFSPLDVPDILKEEYFPAVPAGEKDSNESIPGCCGFYETLTGGNCVPVERNCDANTLGACEACKAVNPDFKW